MENATDNGQRQQEWGQQKFCLQGMAHREGHEGVLKFVASSRLLRASEHELRCTCMPWLQAPDHSQARISGHV